MSRVSEKWRRLGGIVPIIVAWAGIAALVLGANLWIQYAIDNQFKVLPLYIVGISFAIAVGILAIVEVLLGALRLFKAKPSKPIAKTSRIVGVIMVAFVFVATAIFASWLSIR
jgi:hypothetical protein